MTVRGMLLGHIGFFALNIYFAILFKFSFSGYFLDINGLPQRPHSGECIETETQLLYIIVYQNTLLNFQELPIDR